MSVGANIGPRLDTLDTFDARLAPTFATEFVSTEPAVAVSTPTQIRRAYAQLHVSVFLFGFTAIFGALISLPTGPLVWWRLVFTLPVLALYLTMRREWRALPWRDVWRLSVIGLVLGLHWLTFYGAIKLAGAAVALVCLAAASLCTALIEAAWQRRRPVGRQLLQGLLVVVGIALIFTAQGEWLGITVGLVSAFLSALTGVLNKRIVSRQSGSLPAALVNTVEFTAMLLSFSLFIPFYKTLLPADPLLPAGLDWVWIALLAWLCTNLGYELSIRALRHLSAFDFILAINLEPIYGVILAALILGEGRDWNWAFFAGTGLVFVSVFFDAITARLRRGRAA